MKVLKILGNRSFLVVSLSAILSFLFVFLVVSAATTISTNISTGGTLSVTGASTLTGNTTVGGTLGVTGASTLTGNTTVAGTLGVTGLTSLGQASSTRFSVFDTAYFGGTATSTFDSAGNLSVIGTLGVTGASTLTGNTTVAGTLGVTGLTSLGQASSTRFSVFDTAYFGGTATSTFDSAGNLSVNGTITTSGYLVKSVNTALTALAGGAQAGTALTADINVVTTVATAGDSVQLPVAVSGMEIRVINRTVTSLNVFGQTGDGINGGGANVAYAVAGNVEAICTTTGAAAASVWECQKLSR